MKIDSCVDHGSLGPKLVSELARRGEKGMYFSFDEYQELCRVQDSQGLKRILTTAGYPTVVASDDVIQVANGLREAKDFDKFPGHLISDPTAPFSRTRS